MNVLNKSFHLSGHTFRFRLLENELSSVMTQTVPHTFRFRPTDQNLLILFANHATDNRLKISIAYRMIDPRVTSPGYMWSPGHCRATTGTARDRQFQTRHLTAPSRPGHSPEFGRSVCWCSRTKIHDNGDKF